MTTISILIYPALLALLALLVLDWKQTLNIAKNPKRWKETNIILGEHPTVTAVHVYFAAVIVLTALVALLAPIPELLRLILVLIFACIQATVTARNKKLGL